jgi:biotin carboxyl carrier protein
MTESKETTFELDTIYFDIKYNKYACKEKWNTFDIKNNEVFVNEETILSDWAVVAPNKFHVIVNHQSILIEVVSIGESGKQLVLMVNGQKKTIEVQDQFDALLKQLGMDKMVTAKINEVKAPMPGLVLRILVAEGQSVQKGDALLVLEAMKMENIIKAIGEGVVKTIKVEPKLVVEKNQVMLVME